MEDEIIGGMIDDEVAIAGEVVVVVVVDEEEEEIMEGTTGMAVEVEIVEMIIEVGIGGEMTEVVEAGRAETPGVVEVVMEVVVDREAVDGDPKGVDNGVTKGVEIGETKAAGVIKEIGVINNQHMGSSGVIISKETQAMEVEDGEDKDNNNNPGQVSQVSQVSSNKDLVGVADHITKDLTAQEPTREVAAGAVVVAAAAVTTVTENKLFTLSIRDIFLLLYSE